MLMGFLSIMLKWLIVESWSIIKTMVTLRFSFRWQGEEMLIHCSMQESQVIIILPVPDRHRLRRRIPCGVWSSVDGRLLH